MLQLGNQLITYIFETNDYVKNINENKINNDKKIENINK